jgi:hypothetical protein
VIELIEQQIIDEQQIELFFSRAATLFARPGRIDTNSGKLRVFR